MKQETLELTHDSLSEKLVDFEKFVNDHSIVKEYEQYEFSGDDILVRVYKYVPELDTDEPLVLNEFGIPTKSMDEAVIALGKVIGVGAEQKNYKIGDIVILPDSLTTKEINPQFQEWKERADERPKVYKKPPAYFSYGTTRWYTYLFVKDKLMGITEDDMLTFLVPATVLKGKLKF